MLPSWPLQRYRAQRMGGDFTSERLNAFRRAQLNRLRDIRLDEQLLLAVRKVAAQCGGLGGRLRQLTLTEAGAYESAYGNRFERVPEEFTREPLIGPLRGIEALAALPHLHTLSLTGLDCPPLALLQALPYGGGPLRHLALRKAQADAAIITRVLPRCGVTAASVFGMRSCRPTYDVFQALAAATSLTSLSVQWLMLVLTRFS
eukprot:XP_001702433.1 predicted protein [Chlamydomonas reinhardtii]